MGCCDAPPSPVLDEPRSRPTVTKEPTSHPRLRLPPAPELPRASASRAGPDDWIRENAVAGPSTYPSPPSSGLPHSSADGLYSRAAPGHDREMTRSGAGVRREPSFPRGARAPRQPYRHGSWDSEGSSQSPDVARGISNGFGPQRSDISFPVRSYARDYQREQRTSMHGSDRDSNGNWRDQRESISGNGVAVRAVAAGMRESESKLSVGIDFGTTFSGVAYGSTRLFSGEIQQILNWPGSYETYRKVPTCILYEQASPEAEARVLAWGLEAKNANVGPGLVKCEWFKLFLSPESLRDRRRDPRLPALPHGKEPIDVIVDFLTCLWSYAKAQITNEIGSIVDLDSADVLLTVPAAWDAAGCSIMREAAIKAGLVQSARGGDKNWRDRLRIITEPEAAAIHASTLSTLHNLRPSQSFIICDAGGGTVDTAVYRLIGQLSELEIAELCVRSGSNSGSLFVDLRFEELLRNLLVNHPKHLDAPSLAAFMHSFSETEKIAFHGTPEDDNSLYRFNCFNVEDGYDPSIGLERGELAIPGHVLRREVFDPVIEQVLSLLELQMAKIPGTPIDALILVGGFASSEYLFTRVQETFGSRIRVIARPNDCDVATLQGAARYGLGVNQGKGTVSSVISPRAYIMKVKLPAEPMDQYQRPAFIVCNDAGIEVCENRLSYLVARGAVLKKGQRLRSRFCKFTKGPHDYIFTAVLYVSDSDKIFRYTDEGETHELCRWTVDLSALPSYHRIARNGGGYVEFDLGLELDSAEVRGVLMTDDGVECGRATFDFLGA